MSISSPGNRFANVAVRDAGGQGFVVATSASDGQRFERCSTLRTLLSGFDLGSDAHQLRDVSAVGTQDPNAVGFRLSGSGVRLERAKASATASHGVWRTGDGHRLKDVAVGNAMNYGILLDANDCSLQQIHVEGSMFHGLFVHGDRNRLVDVRSHANGSHGIYLRGDGNSLKKAFVGGSVGSGIVVFNDATHTRVQSSTSTGHVSSDAFDFSVCGATAWQSNVFGSINDPCGL